MTWTGEYNALWEAGVTQHFMNYATGFRCEHCGCEFDKNRKALDKFNADGKPAVLTVHHLDLNKSNMDFTNLLSCCQHCHLMLESNWRPQQALTGHMLATCKYFKEGIPYWLWIRGLPYQAVQLSLFGG